MQSAAKEGKEIKLIEMRAADKNPRSFNVIITPPAQFICKNQAILELCPKKTPPSDEDGVSFIGFILPDRVSACVAAWRLRLRKSGLTRK